MKMESFFDGNVTVYGDLTPLKKGKKMTLFCIATANWYGQDNRFIALLAGQEPEKTDFSMPDHPDLLMVFNPKTMELERNNLSDGIFKEIVQEKSYVTTAMSDDFLEQN